MDKRLEPDLNFHPFELMIQRHGWPYVLYENSINSTDRIGYKLSQESDVWQQISKYNDYYGPTVDANKIYPKGGICKFTEADVPDIEKCGCVDDNCDKTILVTVKEIVPKSIDIVKQSVTGTVEWINEKLKLATSSPAWASFKIEAAKEFNSLSFDYAFFTRSQGIFTVYIDGKIVYRSGEQEGEPALVNTGDVAIGKFDAGTHIITFRIDPYQGVQSGVEISNIQLGLLRKASTADVIPPTTSLTFPANGTGLIGPQFEITGTASDGTGSGVKTVEVSTDGGVSWAAAEGTTNWQYTWNISAAGSYILMARATDNAGNIEQPASGVTVTVSMPDRTAPSGSIKVITADNYTKTTSVNISLMAIDPSGVSHMCVSNSDICSDWENYSEQSKAWLLTAGDGPKTIRAWFRDGAGNTNEQPYTALITLDTIRPFLPISALSNGAYTNNATLNITGTATDAGSGLKQLTINGSAVAVAPDSTFSHAEPLVAGANTVTVIATDNAANSTTDTRTIFYDPNAPLLTITAPPDNSRTNKSFIDMTGSIDENASVAVKVNTSQPELAAITDNSFTYTANLVAGSNTIEVTATDLAENRSTAKRTVIYDNLSPSLAIIEPAQDIRISQHSIIIKGTVSDALSDVRVTVSVDGQNFVPAVVNGTFEQSINFTTEKSYAITVTAADEAGNSAIVQRNVIYHLPLWSNITEQTSITKSGTLYDRINNVYYSNISLKNSGAEPISGPLRMVIFNPSIPLKANMPVGLKPDGYTTTGEAYFNLIPQTGILAPGASITNLRVNFEMQRVALTYGVRVEQYK